MTRIIVCGSRSWHDRQKIESTLYDLALEFGADLTIVHGCAKGADRIAEQEAQKAGLLIERHPAEWERFGKAAGPMRNVVMAERGADLCVAFWDGRSTGTAHMLTEAEKRGIPTRIVMKDAV